MPTLSLRRMGLFARYDLLLSWRSIFSQWLVLSLSFALVQAACFWDAWLQYEELSDLDMWEIAVERISGTYGYPAVFIFSVYMLITAILFQYEYRKKQARQQMLMVPVTMAEKFWVRFLRTVLLSGFIALLAYLSSDFFRMVIETIFGIDDVNYIALWPLTNETVHANFDWMSNWFIFVLPIHAFCLFCGCFFRKHIFGMTLLAIVGVSFIVLISSNYILKPLVETIYAQCGDQDVVLWIFRLISGIVTFVQYFIAYRLFVNQQLLGRNLVNV